MAISLCYAATATVATIHTTDAAGNDKVVFDLEETIYIRWKADGTVNIKVEYEDGTIDGQWLNQPESGVIEYNPTKVRLLLCVLYGCKSEAYCIWNFNGYSRCSIRRFYGNSSVLCRLWNESYQS